MEVLLGTQWMFTFNQLPDGIFDISGCVVDDEHPGHVELKVTLFNTRVGVTALRLHAVLAAAFKYYVTVFV